MNYAEKADAIRRPGPIEEAAGDYRTLVHYATLAASSHNTQPWLFRLHESGIDILPDTRRRCPAVDPDDHHLFASLGCAAENLLIAARAAGLEGRCSFDENASGLRIEFEPIEPKRSELFDAIPLRQCSRGEYNGSALTAEQFQQIEAAGQADGVSVTLIDDRDRMQKIADFVARGNTVQFDDAAWLRELQSWIRFSASEAIESGDGLYGPVMGSPSVPRWLGQLIMRFAVSADKQNAKVRQHILGSSAVAVIHSESNDKPHWIETGRCYQRLALQATALGLKTAFIASEHPERGAVAADRLRTLIPGSGHLVHMPAHIYARVDRYHDAVIANQLAIESDNAYLAACRPGPGVYPLGYVPHNHHFLWFAASMEGARDTALAAAEETHARTSDPDLMRSPGFEGMQNFALTPLFAKVRFGLWDDIADDPKPADDLPYMQAMWYDAQGMAALRSGRQDDAQAHHQALAQASTDPEIEKLMMWQRYSLIRGVRVLAAELAHASGNLETALTALEAARDIEDDLPYDEPPGWHAPVRHTLGAMLLEAGRAELRRNPENGWSLYGLSQALRAQGRNDESDRVLRRFETAWAQADVALESSRF